MTDRITEIDQVEAERFAEALDHLEATGVAGLDAREGPVLTALVETAAGIREATLSTSTPRFESYRRRSRNIVLQRARGAETPDRGVGGIPFLRWNVLAPVTSAGSGRCGRPDGRRLHAGRATSTRCQRCDDGKRSRAATSPHRALAGIATRTGGSHPTVTGGGQ